MKSKIAGFFILLLIFLISPSSFAAQYAFTPRVSASETYTDNVNLRDKNTQDDYITEVSAGGTLSVIGRTSGMDLSFDPGYVWYAEGTKDDTWRLPATLNLYSNLSRRTRLTIFNRFLRTEDPQGDETVISDEGEIEAPGDSSVRRGRDPYNTNYATARIDHQFGSDDTVYAQFLYSLRRDEDRDGNDNDRYSPSAGLTYWFGRKWGTTLDATYTKAEFDNSPDYEDILGVFQSMLRFTRTFQLFGRFGYANRDNEEEDEDDDVLDYQLYVPSAGFIYDVSKDSRLTLGLGYYYQDFKDSDVDDEEGPFVNGEVYRLWRYLRWNARLLGDAGLDRNDFGNERLGFEWFARILGETRYNFTRDFYGNVNASYRYGDFINGDRKDNRYRVGVGLGWQPTGWMDLNLQYNFNKLDSTGSENYDENRISLQLTLQPDDLWRF